MWRWIRNTCIVCSLIVGLLCTVFWIRGHWYASQSVTWTSSNGGTVTLGMMGDRFFLLWGIDPDQTDTDFHVDQTDREETEIYADQVWGWVSMTAKDEYSLIGVTYYHLVTPPSEFTVFTFPPPYPVVAACLLVVGLLMLNRRSSKSYRRKHGLCLGCGYDLRGTIDACPECGRAATSSPKAV